MTVVKTMASGVQQGFSWDHRVKMEFLRVAGGANAGGANATRGVVVGDLSLATLCAFRAGFRAAEESGPRQSSCSS